MAASGSGTRRSFLPRAGAATAAAAAGGGGGRGSSSKHPAGGESAGKVRPLRRRSSTEATTGRNRLSVVGACSSRLSSVPGVRITPARNPLNSNYLAPPSSVQSIRLSTESRQSTTGRRKKDVRPITEPAFKKYCVDNIQAFFTDRDYGNHDVDVLSRRVILNPTTRDFTIMFTSLYRELDKNKNYKLPSRFEEEIPKLMKHLQYPVQLPKSSFVAVGSPHTWPALLAMLSWLCDLITDVTTTGPKELCFPPDFESSFNTDWEDLDLFRDYFLDQDENDQADTLKRYLEQLCREEGVDNSPMAGLEEEISRLGREFQAMQEHEDSLPQLQRHNAEMRNDFIKIEEYYAGLQQRRQLLQEEHQQLGQQLVTLPEQHQQLLKKVARLTALKASQNFTAAELLSMKSHAQTSAAQLQQLQQQGKAAQEKIWKLEIQQCRVQLSLSEHIQSYNSNQAASVAGSISSGVHNSSSTTMGLAGRLHDQDLEELAIRLQEEIKRARARVMDALTRRSRLEDECRRWEEQAEEKEHHVAQMMTKINNVQEDASYTKQEIETEESAMMQQCQLYQSQISALRRVPRPELYTKQQQLVQLNEKLDARKQHLVKRTADGTTFISQICLKVNEQLKWEKKTWQNFELLFKEKLVLRGGGDQDLDTNQNRK